MIVLVAVIAAVFFAFKYIKKVKAQRPATTSRDVPPRDSDRRFGWARRVFKAEELLACPRCGTFVRSLKDHACGGKT